MVALLVGSLLLFIVIGVPLAFSIGLSSLVYLLVKETLPIGILAQRTTLGVYSFPFLALPFFVLAGVAMEYGGSTTRILRLASAIVGNRKGGLAVVDVVASMMFGSVSGSGVGATAAVGSIMIPSLKKRGYPAGFAASIEGCSGVLGSLIPPSLSMVIMGVSSGISIVGLLIGGLVPGIVTGLSLIAMALIISSRRGYGGGADATWREIGQAAAGAALPLLTPVIILGGILFGIFTVTEAAVVSVVYALFISTVVFRELSLKRWPEVFLKAARTSVAILIIVGFANLFGWIVTAERVPQMVTELFVSVTDNKWVLLLLINLLLLFLGTFMESTAIILTLGPVLTPVAMQYGVDPVHFGVVFILNLAIGANTPPLGVTLMTAARIAEIDLMEVSKWVWPFILAMTIALLITTFYPPVVTYLPGVLM